MTKIKLFIFSLLLFPSLYLYSQETLENQVLKRIFKNKDIEFKKEPNFNNAYSFFILKNWDSTLVYSMKYLNSSKNEELNDYCHFFRGYSFKEKKLYKEAESEMNQVSNKFKLYPLVNKNLGVINSELRNFEKAINYFKEVEKIPVSKNQGYSISTIYTNIGTCYLHINEFILAEKYLFKSLKLQEKEKNITQLTALYIDIANLYYLQYKDNKAFEYFKKAYDLSKKENNFDNRYLTAYNMAVIEEDRKNFKTALIYRKESEQWTDSLNNQNKIWAVADFEKKFAVAQKQKQIKVLEVENELKATQRNILFYSAIILLILIVIGAYLYAQKLRNEKIILFQKNKLNELNTTKDQLFSIVSHDLRSSVNALKTSNSKLTEALENKNYNELDELLHTNSSIANGAYSLLDNLLHWALLQTKQLYFHKESVHLHSIVQQIEYNYKALLLDKTITLENKVSKNNFVFVDLDSLKIILRNLLDNAIKFSNENSTIKIYTEGTETDFCRFIIEDTGIGMSPNTISELLSDSELLAKKNNSEIIGTGLGMQLCKQMIKKNNGTLTIESELNQGTKMILLFPKIKA